MDFQFLRSNTFLSKYLERKAQIPRSPLLTTKQVFDENIILNSVTSSIYKVRSVKMVRFWASECPIRRDITTSMIGVNTHVTNSLSYRTVGYALRCANKLSLSCLRYSAKCMVFSIEIGRRALVIGTLTNLTGLALRRIHLFKYWVMIC